MDKRLVYDPNIDLSNYNTYQETMNNYNPASVSYNLNPSNIQHKQQQLPNIQQMQQPLPPHIMPHQYMIPENYNIEKMTSKKSTSNKKSKFKELCSISTLRKLFVITILYVLISHNKTSLLLCNHVPYIYITNSLSYNIVKGIIMSVFIILFWGLL